ncbi:ABC transporter substrate-binding protein [Methylobacterium frigidaeris]|uniref:Leucine-binding protein domain-containing protein n=1 Tax=Methylobacterium frigidaeris TaxID=2038277 RepID=A0AA37HI63_9HYPH|nr:ABC transporter substrate-binding protein [Methylobacterium frigidaeris]PIK72083.1 ABC transporter permease [Methylobacterium frigidaeris]GJD66049.1 hypothetical protein MPEAHAMD_6245 [Methylobacterium frigidaeris]
MRIGTLLLAAAFLGPGALARAADVPVKLGVLTDLSGPYSALSGEGSVIATRMAVEEFVAAHPGYKVEVVSADHQNKADIASSVSRKWFDQDGVDALVDGANSAVALAVNQIIKERNKVFLASGPATSDLTGKACNANVVHWTYDTYALSQGTGAALTRQGWNKWFFLTADYAFGHAAERDTSAVVEAAGGRVLGRVRAPLNTADFSSYLLQAQASGATVLGLANAGADMINAVKQASEFGLTREGMKLAGMLVFITDVKSLGTSAAQGLVVTEAFYWDLNDRTRAFAKRFAARAGGRMPTMIHAGAYAASLHYLRSVAALGAAKDGAAAVAKMKELPTDDPAFGTGSIRKDGRKMHDLYLFEVKKPSESKGEWDLYKQVATIPAQEAFRPLDKGGCALVQ